MTSKNEGHGVTDVTGVHACTDAAADVTLISSLDVSSVTNEQELHLDKDRESGDDESMIPDEKNRPAYKVFDDWEALANGRKLRPGVYYFGIKAGKNGEPAILTQQWICSPLHVEAVTYDAQANNFGRWLRFKNTLGNWRTWAMPMELRAGGDDLRGALLGMGVEIDPNGKVLLSHYLQASPPKRRMHCALQVGWYRASFVLPDTVIGAEAADVVFQSGECGADEYQSNGTLLEWQEQIGRKAVGNPLLMLAISTAFAGPLLKLCDGESGGIHIVGDSSTGKTTAIIAACSVYGGASYRRSWRATANGMEGAAAQFNDCLLALDEISECDPKQVGQIIYALGNGVGKQRASRSGSARTPARWRCFVLSSGERSIATAMMEGGQSAKAGQAVRLIDIPAARKFGIFDELHGMTSGAQLSEIIKRSAQSQHGTPGRAFLEKLTRDRRDFCRELEAIKSLPDLAQIGGEGQDKRVAGRFALIAFAGALATEYQVTGWPPGAALAAAVDGFNAWRVTRSPGNDERRQICERVSGFIERHGDSRFSSISKESMVIVRERAGWWRESNDESRQFLFTSEGMREVLLGFDFNRALDVLQEVGALPPPGANGERSRPQRVEGKTVRLYEIFFNKLEVGYGAKLPGNVTAASALDMAGVTERLAPALPNTSVTVETYTRPWEGT